jgi:hypothetical protein
LKLKKVVRLCWWVGWFNSLKKTNQLVSNTLRCELLSMVRLIVQLLQKPTVGRLSSNINGEVDCALHQHWFVLAGFFTKTYLEGPKRAIDGEVDCADLLLLLFPNLFGEDFPEIWIRR